MFKVSDEDIVNRRMLDDLTDEQLKVRERNINAWNLDLFKVRI